MELRINNLAIENFKGVISYNIDFLGENKTICGQNASGKTTIFDAITWLLFGVDSAGNAKFEIRPLDEHGQKIHNTVISVSAELSVGDAVVTLKRSQKEKWTKHRGDESAQLEGNTTEYEIDGYPKSDKEYSAYIASIIDAKKFKALTNPMYFATLPWKEQRAILMQFVAQMPDAELAKQFGGYEPIIDELNAAPSTDDILKKYQKARLELQKKQTEIPARIDELAKQIPSEAIDKEGLNQKKFDLDNRIADLTEQMAASDVNLERQKIRAEILELENQYSELERELNAENDSMRKNIKDTIAKTEVNAELSAQIAKGEKAAAENNIESVRRRINTAEQDIDNYQKRVEELQNEYKEEKNRPFTDNVCGYCGQILPKDKAEESQKRFEAKQKQKIADIIRRGKEAGERRDNTKNLVTAMEQELRGYEAALSSADAKIAKIEADKQETIEQLTASLNAIPEHIDIATKAEGAEITKKIHALEEQMDNLSTDSSARAQIGVEILKLKQEMEQVDKQLADIGTADRMKERITELQEELKAVSQKITQCEKITWMVQEFIKQKMRTITTMINSKFANVRFKMFNQQLNGGIAETCEMTWDGVPYSDLNNGHRIIAGLEVIKALQELYGLAPFLIVDNAESINDYNLPKMQNQVILLKVTDDKKLTIN